jgi:hypothetical protein
MFFCGFAGVFEGCFRKRRFWRWLNRGEIVVDCVVNVDAGMLIFRDRKMGHQFPIYFLLRLATFGTPLKWFAGTAGTSNSHGEKYGDPSLRSG